MNKNLTLMEMINKIYVEPKSDKQKRKRNKMIIHEFEKNTIYNTNKEYNK